MQIDSIQLSIILKDFHKEISSLKSEQKDLLFRVKKAIEKSRLQKINKTLGRK